MGKLSQKLKAAEQKHRPRLKQVGNIVEGFLDKGEAGARHAIKYNALYSTGLTDLHVAILSADPRLFMEKINDARTDLEMRTECNHYYPDLNKQTPLQLAVNLHQLEFARILLTKASNTLNEIGKDGLACIHRAIINDTQHYGLSADAENQERLAFLFSVQGVDKTLKTREGLSPIALACEKNKDALVSFLLNALPPEERTQADVLKAFEFFSATSKPEAADIKKQHPEFFKPVLSSYQKPKEDDDEGFEVVDTPSP